MSDLLEYPGDAEKADLTLEYHDDRVGISLFDYRGSMFHALDRESARQMAMWILSKTGGIDEPAPHGAKLCPVCCDHRLVNFRTAKHEAFDKPGYRHCSGCGTDIPWHLDEGQPPLLGSNRATAKTEKGNG